MIAAEKFRVRVEKEDQGLRLDQYLALRVPELSRRKARVLLDIGGVFVNRARVKVASRKVKEGQLIEVHLGGALERATKKTGKAARASDAEKLPKHNVLHEDEHLLIAFKPAGLLTAPTPESDRGNLADALGREAKREIFVVHRLDLDTSGILVFAKTSEANKGLSETFRTHDIEREYTAIVDGEWPEGLTTIEEDISGKRAVSHIQVIKRFASHATQLQVNLETGRTHQIRIHTAGAGHYVLGDRQYGSPSALRPPRLALHARLLAFQHPVTKEAMRFEAKLPPDLSTWLEKIS